MPLYVAPQAQVMATLSAVADERMQTAAGMYEIRRHVLDFDNAGAPMVLILWAEKATGRLIRYSIAAAGVDVVREDLTSVFTREVKEFRENDQTLLVPALGFNLGATISRPAGKAAPGKKDKNIEKLPAIVLVGGSGNVDRDTIAHGIPVMGQLAGQLADAGYLVVRYDKRGVGQSGGRAESATLSDYADDVLSVVSWLRKQKDVDDRRVYVVGHSEGGAVALIAATRAERHQGGGDDCGTRHEGHRPGARAAAPGPRRAQDRRRREATSRRTAEADHECGAHRTGLGGRPGGHAQAGRYGMVPQRPAMGSRARGQEGRPAAA